MTGVNGACMGLGKGVGTASRAGSAEWRGRSREGSETERKGRRSNNTRRESKELPPRPPYNFSGYGGGMQQPTWLVAAI